MPLLLLPNLLGEMRDHTPFFPSTVNQAMSEIDGLIAESEGGGRSYLKRFKTKKKPHEVPIALLNKHTSFKDLEFLLEPVQAGETWGIVTDAGLPCLADPGSALILRAKQMNIPIVAFVGPSSIFLALMQSGLSGQRFTFHGYIGKTPEERRKELLQWEKASKYNQETQIFIEAPYRNEHTLKSCLEVLHEKTLLCVAWDLTLPTQEIRTLPIFLWRQQELPPFEKKPAIFLFFAP